MQGYEKAARNWDVRAACAVGMAPPNGDMADRVTNRHHIDKAKVFYLQGGFDMKKYKGINLFMMKVMKAFVGNALKKKADKTPEEISMLNMLDIGEDFVSEDNLEPVVSWVKEQQ